MYGLIVRSPWSLLIASGQKRIEVRGSATARTGETIAILDSSSHTALGTCTVEKCIPLDARLFDSLRSLHCIPSSYGSLPYSRPFGWLLSSFRPFGRPLRYAPKKGCVIWIKDAEKTFLDEIPV